MKGRLVQFATLVALGVVILCGSAQALTFSVSDIAFTEEGNEEGFTWAVSPEQDISFDLNVGEKYAFKYGTFTALSFSQDEDDWFLTSFVLTPPEAADATEVHGEVVAKVTGQNKFSVRFDDFNSIDVALDDGSLYKIIFSDITNTKFEVGIDMPLMATVNYTTGPTPIPNPEPSTIVLLGSGLLGLICVARKRSRQ